MTIASLPRLNKAMVNAIANAKLNDTDVSNHPQIVHFGLGAFHRAHQAWYTYHANRLDKPTWKIVGVSLRSADVAEQLNPQQGLYTLIEQNTDNYDVSLIDVIEQVLVAPNSPERVLAAIADIDTKIISLTITEKGYYHDSAIGALKETHQDIEHDLTSPNAPKTAIGFIVRGIERRVRDQLPPLTILSCDNLPANGALLKRLVLRFAEKISPALAQIIAQHYAFPSCMVDRIVPAMSDSNMLDFSQKLGYSDKAMVVTEYYSNWVIEDNFVSSRPSWEKLGVQMVSDVHPYETMKLRLLNGSHSAIAYIGYLLGCETVADAMKSRQLQSFIKRLMNEELIPTVVMDDAVNLYDYCEQLIRRFTNAALHHKTYQIAMDGSQKLPQRLLAPLTERLAAQKQSDLICFVLAAWIKYSSGCDMRDEIIWVQDPLAEKLSQAYIDNQTDISAWVNAVFQINEVFHETLRASENVKASVTKFLSHMQDCTSLQTVLEDVLEIHTSC